MIESFGKLDGRDVDQAHLVDGDTSVSILNYGCVTRDWRVDGQPMVLGFERFEDYPRHSRYFGAIAGRVANRTALGRFDLGGKTYQLTQNDGVNHLHGGKPSLGTCLWEMDADGDRRVQLRYHSPDGEQGYPGTVDFEVTISLQGNKVTYEMIGRPDRETPINLAQHNYYNLGGENVLEHELRLSAAHFTPVGEGLIPTGEIAPVSGRLDFLSPQKIGMIDPEREGIDLNFVLSASEPAVDLKFGARHLRLWTDQPGLQVFNAPMMDITVPGLDGKRYGPFAGLCLEAQKFPDALNRPEFPSVLATPDRPYQQTLNVQID